MAANLDHDETLPTASYRTTSMGGEVDAGFQTSMNEAFSNVTEPNGTWTLYVYDNWKVVSGYVSDASLTFNPVVGQINDGEATFVIGYNDGYGSSLIIDIEYLSYMGWSYRLDIDTQEYLFPKADYAIYDEDTVTITWLDVDDKGFRADLTHVIDQTGLEADQAILTSTMKITNLNAADIDISLFSLADFDVNGINDDMGQLVNDNISHIRQTDGPYQVEFRAGGNENYQIGNYESVGFPLVGIDGDIDDLPNGENGYGPDNIATAFQWFSGPLSADSSYQVQTTVAVGGITAPEPADPVNSSDLIFADGFD